MAEIIVTSTADSGAGSLRAAIDAAQDGDVILFDSVVFPQGQTTAVYLSSYITIDKSISIYGGESDGQGGYTSGATKEYYVYRDVDDVRTKVVISSPDDAQEGETVLFSNVCRVALDGQGTVRGIQTGLSSEFTISGITFNNGGVTISGNSAGTLDQCYVANATAQNGAGIFLVSSAVATINGCAIYNCTTTGIGGGTYVRDNNNIATFNNCCFDSCSANNGGGFVSYNTSQSTLYDCLFYNCTALGNGGAALSYTTSQNVFNNCVMIECSAASGGAVHSSNSSRNTLNNCTLSNCNATSTGGAVYSNNDSINILNACDITNCTATNNGGGIYTGAASQNTLNACTINGCSAKNGGGCYIYGATSQTELNNCVISDCVANSGGGVQASNTSQSTFNDCVISHCISHGNGGGVCVVDSCQSTLNNCDISDCGATSYGGGVYVGNNSSATLNNCEITQNTGNNGGGLCAYSKATANINNCIIKDNITTSTDQTQKDVSIISTSYGNITASEFGTLRISQSATVTFVSGVTTAQIARLLRQNYTSPTITINDGAALTITDSAPTFQGTFTSEGRGYLATAAGIDTSSATLTNVVLCAYGADVSSFAEVDGVLKWSADDPSVSVLIEREDNDAWTTLAQTTGESLDYYLPPKVNLRLFDGERFLTTATPDSRTYFYIGGAEGSFDDAEDWSLTKDGTAISQSPTITDCAFVIQGAEGDVAISKGSADVTNATIIPAGTNDIAVVVDEATVLAGTERFTGTLTTTGDVAITGDASKLAIVVDGTLEVAGSLKLATLTLTSGSSVVFASADDVLVVTDSATVNDATFSCEEPTAYFTAPVGTDLTQATFTNVYVATKGAEVESVTGSRFGKNYSINIISEDNTLPVTVEYRLEGTTEWIVADPAFVGTTFQIRLEDDATFRVYNGEKFTEATMKVYGLYNEMAAIVEIGYLI